ncbi:MAG: type II CRISPR RNA-guided endonuclease Cas9 [Pseudomonadota bacterium]
MLTAEEFDLLWQNQQSFHPGILNETARADLRDTLLHQRDLRPVRPGKCTFEPSEERAPWALPIAQRKRILEELNNLKMRERGQPEKSLTLAQRDLLAGELAQRAKLSFDQMRAKLKLPGAVTFSLESEKRKELKGDETAVRLSKKECFGKAWFGLHPETQNAIVERLLDEADEAKMISWLTGEHGLSDEAASAAANINLPDGYANLGRTALWKITPELEKEVIVYSEAAARAGYHHSDFRDGEIFDALPYYGIPLERHVAFGSGEPSDPDEKRYGKIANPTVHVALNQLRKLVNALIAKYGHPEEVIVELSRHLKNSREKREEIEKKQKENQQHNDYYRQEMAKIGVADNGENRMRMRLWEELNHKDILDRRCPYSGEQISLNRLFTNEVEIDHILPFSRTWDNSAANRIVSMRWANRIKSNRPPHDAFSSNPHPKIVWEDILDRVAALPKNKQWRFQPDAMDRFEKEGGFLDRQLTDNQYLSRIAKTYLTKICNSNRVWVTPGRLTSMLRGRWGLNSILSDHNRKNRTDHRHHAIDAIVIGVTDRSLLNRISRAAARAEEKDMEKLLDETPEPFPGFRDEVKAKVQAIIVSHKPDHGRQGALHNDTAYGIVSGPNAKGVSEVVTRVPVTSLKKMADIELIRDESWRERIRAAVEGLPEKEMKQALQNLSDETGLRRIRIIQPLSVIPIKDRKGRIYKGYKGDSNSYYEIFQTPKGKWDGEVISTFDANQKNFTPRWRQEYPTAPLIMRLFKDDLVELEHDGQRRVMRVVKFSQGAIYFAEHFEGGALKARDAASNDEDPFKYLIKSPSSLQKADTKIATVAILG